MKSIPRFKAIPFNDKICGIGMEGEFNKNANVQQLVVSRMPLLWLLYNAVNNIES